MEDNEDESGNYGDTSRTHDSYVGGMLRNIMKLGKLGGKSVLGKLPLKKIPVKTVAKGADNISMLVDIKEHIQEHFFDKANKSEDRNIFRSVSIKNFLLFSKQFAKTSFLGGAVFYLYDELNQILAKSIYGEGSAAYPMYIVLCSSGACGATHGLLYHSWDISSIFLTKLWSNTSVKVFCLNSTSLAQTDHINCIHPAHRFEV